MKIFLLIILLLSCESRQVSQKPLSEAVSNEKVSADGDEDCDSKETIEKKLVENQEKVFDLQGNTDEGCKL